MPKYHFEIVDDYRLEDPVGMDVPSEEHARTVAENIAQQIVEDHASSGDIEVVVIDDKGDEVYKAAAPQASPDHGSGT